MIFTAEDREKIRILWNSGKTGAEIGAMYGVSRCSIIGLINRMKAKGADVFGKPKIKKPKAPRIKKTMKVVAPIKKTRPTINLAENIELIDLTPRSCRYVVSEVDASPILFCGKEIEHRSYCEEHAKICYIQPKDWHKYQSTE